MSIREQKIHSREANRVRAWHPGYTKFPDLPKGINKADPSLDTITRNLVVYLIKTTDGQYWAGWFQKDRPEASWPCPPQLLSLFTRSEGLIQLSPNIPFDENNAEWPFQLLAPAASPAAPAGRALPASPPNTSYPVLKSSRKPVQEANEDELAEALFNGDLDDETPDVKQRMQKVVVRNQKAAKMLKDLYKECQISGDKFLFLKTNGKPYLEAHHLVPLGKGGADSPHNLVVVSAHMHRMLHYAAVTGLDLAHIKNGKLPIKINGADYTITWHPRHVQVVENAQIMSENEEPAD